MFEGKCGIIAVHFFRKTGNRSNKGRCITRMTVFICGVLCRAFPLGIPVASKEITQRHRFFSRTGAGLKDEVCGKWKTRR